MTGSKWSERNEDHIEWKLGQFIEKELDEVLKKIKSRNVAGLDEIPTELLIQWYLTLLSNTVNKQSTIEKWVKLCILLFPKKGDLGIIKNSRDNNIAAKVYNALLFRRIKSW